jgi:excisionase family DNA binding protein
MDKLLDVIKVAELLALHPESIRRLCRAGRIPYLKVAGRLRFDPRAIEAWLSKRSVPA